MGKFSDLCEGNGVCVKSLAAGLGRAALRPRSTFSTLYTKEKEVYKRTAGSLVSVQRAEKTLLEMDKIIHPVNGHPREAPGRKIVCRKRFLSVEKDFQKLATVWGSMSLTFEGKRVAGTSLSCHWSGDSGTNPLK